MTKKQKIAFYVLTGLVSAVFLFSAIPKLMGQEMVIQGFALAGLPVWFMYTIGILEVLGVIGLWVPKTTHYAALGLFIIMLGAIGTTVAFQGVVLAILPLVVAIMLVFIIRINKSRHPVITPAA
jgi:uncharacterized membrane protein YphA (DoxX/SURF4 family)